jgi:hypothetical protein
MVRCADDERQKFEENNANLGRRGERVLGFCMKQLPKEAFPKGPGTQDTARRVWETDGKRRVE